MKTYGEFRPTQFDTRGLGLPDRQDWLVAPCAHNRDSDTLTESNWHAQERIFQEADPRGEDREIHRFGHWGPGWFEIVLVRPGSKCASEADGIESALANYPVLDDSDFSDREHDAACEYWRAMSLRERVALLGRCEACIFSARRDEIPDNDRVWEHLREHAS